MEIVLEKIEEEIKKFKSGLCKPIKLGKFLYEIEKSKIYLNWYFSNFQEFLLCSKTGYSYETLFSYYTTYRILHDVLEIEDEFLENKNYSKLRSLISVLRKFKTKRKRLEILKKAETVKKKIDVLAFKDEIKTDKPLVYWSKKQEKWVVEYYESETLLANKGNFKP